MDFFVSKCVYIGANKFIYDSLKKIPEMIEGLVETTKKVDAAVGEIDVGQVVGVAGLAPGLPGHCGGRLELRQGFGRAAHAGAVPAHATCGSSDHPYSGANVRCGSSARLSAQGYCGRNWARLALTRDSPGDTHHLCDWRLLCWRVHGDPALHGA